MLESANKAIVENATVMIDGMTEAQKSHITALLATNARQVGHLRELI